MKKILIAGILAFALIGITGMSSVSADKVDINVDDGDIHTEIHGEGYEYSSDISTYGGVDITHIVDVGDSFTVYDEWNGYLGGIDIDSSYQGVGAYTYKGDPMYVEVDDSFTMGGLSLTGQQVATGTGNAYYYLDRGANWDIGFATGVTDYRSDVWGRDIDTTFELSAASAGGNLLQEQYFRANEGGTWEHNKYSNRYAVVNVEGPYILGSSIVDNNGDDFGYTFSAYDSDYLFWGGDAQLILERSSVDRDGFYLDMHYHGDSYPTASFSGYDLSGFILTTVNGDEVTMAGIVEGE